MYSRIVLIAFVILFSCKRKGEKPNICACQEEISMCKISLPKYSTDSIQVFTSKFESNYFKSNLDYYQWKSQRDLSLDDIIDCENFIRIDSIVLSSFLKRMGHKAYTVSELAGSGYLNFGKFQMLPIEHYKRQYFGVVDSNNRNKVIVLLFNYAITENKETLLFWDNGNMISRITGSEGIESRYYIFLVDLEQKDMELLYW